MKISVLVDNNSRGESCLISEHGLSFYIEDGDTRLLFDCGSTDAFIKNAYNMQIDLSKLTDVVLSHGHSDHIGGFSRLQALYEQFNKLGIEFTEKRLLSHPDVFKPENTDLYDGHYFKLSREEVDKFFNLDLEKDAKYITSKLVYLGEIPLFYENVKRDYIDDETALAYKGANGLIIFSGCSHSGLKNIIERAKYVCCTSKIDTVVGGIYLINRDESEIHALGKYLQSQHIERIYPCHCTDVEAKAILSKYVKIEDVSTGREYVFE